MTTSSLLLAILLQPHAQAATFTWANGIPLHGSSEADLKVTDDDIDHAGPDDGGGLSCPAGTWPYTAHDLETVFAVDSSHPDYAQGVWALNSPKDLWATMNDLDLNLYIADVNGTTTNISASGDGECNWYSWAGLNDVIQAESGGYPSKYTGIFLGPGEKPGIASHWACTYKPFVERARLEAAQHPDIVKVVELDELHRLIDGADNSLWQGWQAYDTDGDEINDAADFAAHWTPANVEALHDMVASGVYTGPDADANGDTSSDCDSPTSPPTALGGQDLELWARIVDTTIPRYIVHSAVLGMPANPDAIEAHLSSLPPITPDPDYEFADGDSVSVSWMMQAPTSPDPFTYPQWRAQLEFFYVVSTDKYGDIDLIPSVNGTEVTGATVDLATSHDIYTIYRTTECVGGPGCATATWDSTPGNLNSISFSLESTDTNVTDNETRRDRVVHLFGVRIRYVSLLSNTLWQSDIADPDAAGSATYHSTASAHPSTWQALHRDNSDWRIGPYLDGITIASQDYTNFDADSWNVFMEDTCDYMHGFDTPKRCLLDERSSWDSYEAYDGSPGAVDLGVVSDRLPAGDTYGDGVISTWLPTPIEFVNLEGGRFGAKNPIDTSYDVMLYEPRQSRSIPGEAHIYTGTVPSSCPFSDMTYTVAWDIGSDSDATTYTDPLYHWYVQYKDLSDSSPSWNTEKEGQADADKVDSVDITGVDPGDQIRVSWVDVGGGGGPDDAIHALCRADGPTGATGCEVEWAHSTDMKHWVKVKNEATGRYHTITLSPWPTQVYDCITEYFTTGTCTP